MDSFLRLSPVLRHGRGERQGREEGIANLCERVSSPTKNDIGLSSGNNVATEADVYSLDSLSQWALLFENVELGTRSEVLTVL